ARTTAPSRTTPGRAMRRPTEVAARRACSIALVVACAACSSPNARPADPVDAGLGADAAIDEETGDAGIASCDVTRACRGSGRAGQECIVSVDATLVEPSGAPAIGVPVNICGTDVCTRAFKSDASGNVHAAVCQFMKLASLKIFDDPTWAPIAARLP